MYNIDIGYWEEEEDRKYKNWRNAEDQIMKMYKMLYIIWKIDEL